MVSLEIENRTLQMELDTGAAFSVISEATCQASFADVKLRKSNILLKTYTDERIPVIGKLHIHVRYGEQRAPLVLLVVAGDGPWLPVAPPQPRDCIQTFTRWFSSQAGKVRVPARICGILRPQNRCRGSSYTPWED